MRTAKAMAPLGSTPFTAAQTRIIEAALALFAEHGISGTSLQMIADAIGVTKAAVYHQYNAKEEIILAVARMVLARLDAAVTLAEAERSRASARAVARRDGRSRRRAAAHGGHSPAGSGDAALPRGTRALPARDGAREPRADGRPRRPTRTGSSG